MNLYPAKVSSLTWTVCCATLTLSYETDAATANHYGLKAEFDSYSRIIGLNMIEGVDVLRDILPAHIDAIDLKDEWGDHYRERLADTVPVKPGVADVIEHLPHAIYRWP